MRQAANGGVDWNDFLLSSIIYDKQLHNYIEEDYITNRL